MELEGHSSVRWPENMGTKPTAAGGRVGVAPILRRQRGASSLSGSSCQETERAKLSGKAQQLPRRRGPSGSSRNGGEAPPHPNNLTGRPSGREFHACSSSLKKGKNTGSEAIPGGPGTLCQPVRVGGKGPDDSRGPLGHPSASRTFPFFLLPSDEGAAVFTCCPKEGVPPRYLFSGSQ